MPQYQNVACHTCKGRRYIFEATHQFAAAKLCKCQSVCLKCNGIGYQTFEDSQGREQAKPCTCRQLMQSIQCFNHAQIPNIYFDAGLNNFEYLNQPKLKKALKVAQELLKKPTAEKKDTAARFGKGILCYGNPGTGKTRLLAAMLKNYVFKYQLSCKYIEFSHLLSQIRTGYGNNEDELVILNPLIHIDVLAIDELGKGRNREWDYSIIDTLISNRYNLNKITLFATNYAVGKTQKKGDAAEETLINRTSSRIYSRLKEMCVFVDMNLKDYREKDAAANSLDHESADKQAIDSQGITI